MAVVFLAAEPPKRGTGIPSQDSLLWVHFGTAQSKAQPVNEQNFTFVKANCLLFVFLWEMHPWLPCNGFYNDHFHCLQLKGPGIWISLIYVT